MKTGEVKMVLGAVGERRGLSSPSPLMSVGFMWFSFFSKGLVGDHCTFIRSYHLIKLGGGEGEKLELDG